jgi:hypothetical protein
MKGNESKGKERKGKERKGKERKMLDFVGSLLCATFARA